MLELLPYAARHTASGGCCRIRRLPFDNAVVMGETPVRCRKKSLEQFTADFLPSRVCEKVHLRDDATI
jgi:hypothetical protein